MEQLPKNNQHYGHFYKEKTKLSVLPEKHSEALFVMKHTFQFLVTLYENF